jgi:2',3'-cyclic-nucleotide 2'-phosphodiesterase (5'-nucleotidase family)
MNTSQKKHSFNNFLPARSLFILAISLFIFTSTYPQVDSNSAEKTLLILHTNDIHDHLRPDYDGDGGIPFISGFIRDVRSQRNDVIVLDAGDVAEKGDLVARKTGSDLTFEALSRVGYHAWTPGNHDHDFGVDALRRFSELAGMDILCINLLKEDGSPEFEPSGIYEINGLRIGVIGAIVPRDELSLNEEETALAMAQESRRLKQDTDIVLAVVHMSARNAAYISEIAPDIDVFITGHSHQVLHEAIKVPQTGSLIVQAGSDANYVGWLELTLDTVKKEILSYESKLVEMNHLEISPDLELLEFVRQKELELSPEALTIVSWSPREINYAEVGYMAAEALRKATEADITFNHTEQIVRSTLPAGILDLNAVYRTGGERGHQLIEVELSGAEIHSYLQGLQKSKWIQTQWSGFHGAVEDGIFISDLDMNRKYRVVMPEREWNTRFLNLFRRVAENPDEWPGISALNRIVEPKPLDISWTDAMIYLISEWNQNRVGLIEGLERIIDETGQTIHLLLSRYRIED